MRYVIVSVVVIICCCSQVRQYTAEERWATDRIMKTPESVLYDVERNVLYVSNINGSPMGKDGNGFISRLSTNGDILTLEWVSGLNAPKGAAIVGNAMFVSDIDELVEIDIESGGVVERYPVQGFIFLNDVAADDSGNVYISDSSEENSVIYRFDGAAVTEWLRGDEISMPNGLCTDDGYLVVGNTGDGSIKRVDLATRSIERVATVGSGIDGLRRYGDHGYVVSDWKGTTSLVLKGEEKIELLNTTDAKINAADLEFLSEGKLLVIPTFYDNRVVAYTIEMQ
jgi:sugar lactone lactonase YvrE